MKLYQILEEQLKKEPNYVTDDGQLKKWVVLNKAQNSDQELIGLLLDNNELKAKFFTEVKGVLVFNQSLFSQFLEQKNYLNDSYTQFKNKIGLSVGGKYLHQRNEVSLVWPFKDCVLEGGQSREEDKREEIFFNEVLAQDEITQLFEPKVLTNFRRYNEEQVKKNTYATEPVFKRRADGTISDNLIIKGNNLLALHSLKKEFAGKVKMIYIDPPYNTGSDGFKYNDRFNHSTWLTFIKNRLEVAKQLLRDDGVIWLSINDKEGDYLKVLMDDIFGRENYEETFYIKVRHENRILREDIRYQQVIERLICYRKSNAYSPSRREKTKNASDDYCYNIEIKKDSKPERIKVGGYDIDVYRADEYIISKTNFGEGDLKQYSIRGSLITQKGSASEFYEKYLRKRKTTDGLSALYKVIGMGIKGDGLGYRYITQPSDTKTKNGIYYQGKPVSKSEDKGLPYQNYFDFMDEFNNVGYEGDVSFSNGKKPEHFINLLIEMSNAEMGDIILDYHMGSGSTATTCHKLGFQYIGIEQMDYIETIAINRLTKVMNGEQGGVSKAVNWQGGGEFVYFELKKYNQEFIERIEEAKTTDNLLKIWSDMKQRSFLNYNIDIKKQDEHIEEFKQLTLDEQKRHLVEILDKNQLYVNLSSLDDQDFACSDDEKKLTKGFYQI